MSAPPPVFESAVSLMRRLDARDVSATEVLEAHIAQIERVDPHVNAVVTRTFDAARRDAASIDGQRARGERVGPLAGLPVAHKDLVPTRGVRTTFGSPIFADHVPDADALIVERLKAAGAVTVGKTNTPEFGAGSHTFNPVFGATRNPWDPTRSCGGSSGGAAVALACGFVPIADGTDLGGSLRNPASFNGVVGLRPSPGVVPNWPALDAWFSLGVAGPMARSVADCALMLSAIAGPDPRAPTSLDAPGRRFGRPLARDFTDVRVAWSPRLGDLPVEAAVLDALAPALRHLETIGCHVEAADPDLRDADRIFETLRAWIFESTHGALLDQRRDQLKATVIWNIEQGRALGGPDIARAERARTALFHRMRSFFERYDYLVCPVAQVAPFPIDTEYPTTVDGTPMTTYIEWMRSCSRISATTLPALSVPAAFDAAGLPVGLQIVGRWHDDFGVLQLGHAFEQTAGMSAFHPPLAN
ncbi:MAG: amidase [Burkholderiales bacterium]|jgi:amidase|nr:amidase [Burkholderiales bacterium]